MVTYTSVVINTTLTIPPPTTTEIPVRNTIPGKRDIHHDIPYQQHPRPPITVVDPPNPLDQSGVSHPPVTRTIYPGLRVGVSVLVPSLQPTAAACSRGLRRL